MVRDEFDEEAARLVNRWGGDVAYTTEDGLDRRFASISGELAGLLGAGSDDLSPAALSARESVDRWRGNLDLMSLEMQLFLWGGVIAEELASLLREAARASG